MTTFTAPLDMELRDTDGPIFAAVLADHNAAAFATWHADHCGSCGRAIKKRNGSPVRHRDQPGGEWCVGGVAS